MASPFQRYQSGIEASTGNLVPAYGQMAGQTANAIAGFGQNLAQGIQQYNENSAKNEILTNEAAELSQQILQFKNQFGDSPEHAPFAQSLQPYIDKLAKIPSMSLTQKMGTVTGVKAAFGNIGQQLQVFELMRKERTARDMNAARGGVREYDEQTVPTAIIPSGKLPYFYNKNYTEQENELVRLANEAKARGANVDLPSVLDNWRKGLKANAMSRPDLPPQIKEALVKQIDAGEGLESNIQTDESGVTDYAKEAEMYDKASTSVKEQLAPKKVESPANKGTAPVKIDKETEEKRTSISNTIEELEKRKVTTQTVSDAEFNKLVDADPSPSRYTKVANLEKQGWKKSVDKDGKVSWSRKAVDEAVQYNIDAYKGMLDKLPKPQVAGQKAVDPKVAEAESVKRKAKAELTKIDALIKQADKDIAEEKDIPAGWMKKAELAIESGLLDPINEKGFQEMARMYISQGRVKEITPDVARMILNELNSDSMGGMAALGAIITPDPSAFGLGLIDSTRELSRQEIRNLEGAFTDWRSQDRIKRVQMTGDADLLKKELQKRKQLLEGQLATGRSAPRPADISKAQQAATPAEAKPEPEYALTNQYNMNLGTTTAQVATSMDSKRKDMMKFFTDKYGYVPASFEESFKSIYPEANFKTMETPYGVFMYDGKDWKQVQMQQVKPPSRKELAEEKAVSFGKLQPDSSIDINEFGELVPNSGVYVRGIFGGTPTEAFQFRTQMLEGSNAKKAVARLTEINDMVGESMPWNSKVWGEAKALLPQIKAGLRTDIIGVGTVSNYEQELINDVVANPALFWSLESSDRAKLAVIMDKISNKLVQAPANYGLEVRVAGKRNEEIERGFKMGRAGKSKLELDFEARGGKGGLYMGGSTGAKLDWKLTNKIPDALKQ